MPHGAGIIQVRHAIARRQSLRHIPDEIYSDGLRPNPKSVEAVGDRAKPEAFLDATAQRGEVRGKLGVDHDAVAEHIHHHTLKLPVWHREEDMPLVRRYVEGFAKVVEYHHELER
jgi:hypothetical protein